MRRRKFLGVAFGAAAAWPLAAGAQEQARRVGVLMSAAAGDAEGQANLAAFLQRLQQLGWSDGSNLRIDARWAAGNADETRKHIAEAVALAPDVILASGGSVISPLLQATRIVPIVFTIVADPVGAGYIMSLARPGGNVTGLSIQTIDLSGKRLEFLREVVPDLRRLAIIGNNDLPAAALEMREIEAKARALGIDVSVSKVRRAADIVPAFEAVKARAQALYVCADWVTASNRAQLTTLARGARLATMFSGREDVEAGGLMSYGPSFSYLYRRAADLVDKILRGVKPAEIPVEQSTKFDLIINLTTAKSLGLSVPPTLLARADEVIE